MREPTFFLIPAGTRRSVCRSCDEVGFWITTAAGRRLLLDLQAPGALAPTNDRTGRGTAHFATCPNADAHRNPRGN